MKHTFAVPVALVTACLSFAKSSHAATYVEGSYGTGDAGGLPATAQVTAGTAGAPLTAISGALTFSTSPADNLSDTDMFEIYISSPSTFSAMNTAFTPGANNFDSQLALFTAAGTGVVANDDASTGGDQSDIPAGSLTLAAGDYYLLVSGSGNYAVDSTGALIFPNYTDGVTDPSSTVAASSVLPITGYTGASNEGGAYLIALTGAQFVTNAVPEPGTYAGILLGAAGVFYVGRLRRVNK